VDCETYLRNVMKGRGLNSSGSEQEQVNVSCEYQDNFGLHKIQQYCANRRLRFSRWRRN